MIPVARGDLPVLKGGWYHWDPYQFEEKAVFGTKLSGLDILLLEAIAKEAGYKIDFKHVLWKEHLEQIKNGEKDIASAAFKIPNREKFAYYSIPYRDEENSLFIRKDDDHLYTFSTPEDLVEFAKMNDFKLGAVPGYRYANEALMKFIEDPQYASKVKFYTTDNESLNALLNGDVDAFFADRITGSTLIWRHGKRKLVSMIDMDIKEPVYFIFSKVSTSLDVVSKFNTAIKKLKESGEFHEIVSKYLHPILLMQTIDTQWFFVIEVLGTIAFALSGIVIAYREQTTLIGAFIFCALPPIGGTIIRDLMLARNPLGFIQTPIHLGIVLAIVVIGFIYLKLLRRPFLGTLSKTKLSRLRMEGERFLRISDSVGISSFSIVGVTVALAAKLEPLWLWGPFFAVVTGSAGGMLRDVSRKDRHIEALRENFGPEIGAMTGLVLSLLLIIQKDEMDPDKILLSVLSVLIMGIAIRLYLIFTKARPVMFTDRE